MSGNIKIHEAKPLEGDHCIFCRFYKPISKDPIMNGECRFNPPLATPLIHPPQVAGGKPQINFLSYWPQLAGDQYCGRFQKLIDTEAAV